MALSANTRTICERRWFPLARCKELFFYCTRLHCDASRLLISNEIDDDSVDWQRSFDAAPQAFRIDGVLFDDLKTAGGCVVFTDAELGPERVKMTSGCSQTLRRPCQCQQMANRMDVAVTFALLVIGRKDTTTYLKH